MCGTFLRRDAGNYGSSGAFARTGRLEKCLQIQ
jgi:hypothetical protein